MPSKNGFGNTRTPMKKVGYGSAMHYKNPVKMTAAQETLPENLKAGIRAKEEKGSMAKMYDKGKNPIKKSLGKLIGSAVNSSAGQGIIGHVGKSLIDKLLNKGGRMGLPSSSNNPKRPNH